MEKGVQAPPPLVACNALLGGDHTEDKMGVHVHAKKAYGGRRDIASLIPNPGLRLSGQLHAPPH